jgi:hypothetical protein
VYWSTRYQSMMCCFRSTDISAGIMRINAQRDAAKVWQMSHCGVETDTKKVHVHRITQNPVIQNVFVTQIKGTQSIESNMSKQVICGSLFTNVFLQKMWSCDLWLANFIYLFWISDGMGPQTRNGRCKTLNLGISKCYRSWMVVSIFKNIFWNLAQNDPLEV